MTFGHNDKMNRIDGIATDGIPTSFKKQLNAKKEKLKNKLLEMALENEWKKLNQMNEFVPMEMSDFDNIKVNALNVQQNKVCRLDELKNGRINKVDTYRCNQLPWFDESLDYYIPDDKESRSRFPNPFAKYDVHDDKWIFIEEAKNLQQIIVEFSKHPVSTQTIILKQEYDVAMAAYRKRNAESVMKKDAQIFKLAGVNLTHCDAQLEKDNAEIDSVKQTELAKCPT